MAVTILDSLTTPVTPPPATISPSAGSDRWVVLMLYGTSGSDADPPSSVSLGGQSMTLLAGGIDTAGNDATFTQWGLNEAGIAAMSGTTLTVTGGSTGTGFYLTWLSIQDADQASPTTAEASGNGTSGTASLARVADGYTIAGATVDTSSFSSGSDPTTTTFSVGSSEGGYATEASTSETVDYSISLSAARDYEMGASNFGPATGGGGGGNHGLYGNMINGLGLGLIQ